jgi:hypothetical protein
MWVVVETCDAELGITCEDGACVGECLPANLLARGRSHLGCEFFATSSSANTPNDEALGVFVTNPGDQPATVRAERPPWSGIVVEVAPHASASMVLPWATDIVSPGGTTALSRDGAVRIASDRPITVAQHNPIAPMASGGDASLLLPVTSWGTRHVVAGYAGPEVQPGTFYEGFYVVVAAEDGTQVKVDAPAGIEVHPGLGVGTDGGGEVTLDRGDVLQVLAKGPNDLTGSFVDADKPVQVLGGHRCARVPIDVGFCQHLEESLPPVMVLGDTYAVVPPVTDADPALRRAQIVRVIAAESPVGLQFTPEVAPPTMLAAPGDFLEIGPVDTPFVVVSTGGPVLTVQYMIGGAWDDSRAAPAMTITPPQPAFVAEQSILAAPGWDSTDVDIVAPAGTLVKFDGSPLTEWTSIPSSGVAFGHVRLGPDDALGTHTIVADVPVGVSVYAMGAGVTAHASYWHPAGFSL